MICKNTRKSEPIEVEVRGVCGRYWIVPTNEQAFRVIDMLNHKRAKTIRLSVLQHLYQMGLDVQYEVKPDNINARKALRERAHLISELNKLKRANNG